MGLIRHPVWPLAHVLYIHSKRAFGLKKTVFLIRLNTKGNIEFAPMNFSLVNTSVRTFVPIYD
jgi:hypothetical protein